MVSSNHLKEKLCHGSFCLKLGRYCACAHCVSLKWYSQFTRNRVNTIYFTLQYNSDDSLCTWHHYRCMFRTTNTHSLVVQYVKAKLQNVFRVCSFSLWQLHVIFIELLKHSTCYLLIYNHSKSRRRYSSVGRACVW